VSKHLFYTIYRKHPAYVLLGWDKSLQGYFMVVDYLNHPRSSPLFNHADLTEPYPNSIDYFLRVLEKELAFPVPDEMIIEIIQDAKAKEDTNTKEVIHAVIDGCHQREEGIIDTISGAVVRVKSPKILSKLMDAHNNLIKWQ